MSNFKIGGRSGSLKDFSAAEILGPPSSVVKLEEGDDFAMEHGLPKAIWVGTPGTLNFTDPSGNTITGFPVFEGRNDITFQALNTGGTADDIWALF